MAPFTRITRTILKPGFILLFLFFSSAGLIAQRVIVNSNGERIIMFPDGSWRLAEAGDSILINNSNLQKAEALGQIHDSLEPAESRTEAEREEFLARQWNELHFKIKAVEKKIQNEFRKATNAQFSASEIYYNAQANKAMIDTDRLARIYDDYEKSIQRLKLAKQQQTSIKKLLDQSRKIANLPAAKLENKLNRLNSKFNLFMSAYDAAYIPVDKNIPLLRTDEKTNRKSKEDKQREEENERVDVLPVAMDKMPVPVGQRKTAYKSVPRTCKFTMDSIDPDTDRKRRELEDEVIFTHTDTDLRPYFKEKELITCEGRLSQLGEYIYLHITFKIASSHSQSNFGSLEKGSLLRLRLLNSETVSLYNIREDKGRIDAYSGHTVFTGQYGLGKEEIKLLKEAELDGVRILWSTGYEDYDVYNVDFIASQLDCLLNN